MIGFSAGAITTLAVALANKPDARPAFIGLMYGPQNPVQPPQNAPPLFDALAADDLLFVGKYRAGAVVARGGQKLSFTCTRQVVIKNGTTAELWPGQFLAWLSLNKFVCASNSDRPRRSKRLLEVAEPDIRNRLVRPDIK
jgi:hypothetical protein